jgi:hypothetical protein
MKNGYIVLGNGSPMHWADGVLWFGSSATVFSTRELARQAIKQTDEYAKMKKYASPNWNCPRIIMPIENVPLSDYVQYRGKMKLVGFKEK